MLFDVYVFIPLVLEVKRRLLIWIFVCVTVLFHLINVLLHILPVLESFSVQMKRLI
jgi:hypothetical protein